MKKSYKKIGSMLLITGAVLGSNQASAQNGYVLDEVIKKSGVTSDASIYSLGVTDKQTTKTFYDGLGRTIQTIGLQASPLQRDLIQPMAYDNLSRQLKGYLPYAGKSTDVTGSYRTNAISTDQPAFYNDNTQYLVATDIAAYIQQTAEASPLQRVLQAGMAGDGFQPASGQHYKTISYRANNSGDGNILVWNPDGSQTSGNYYAANSLSVTDGTDEQGKETLSFTDLSGHVVLKRQILSGGNLDTYYIFNLAGMVNYIIPPQALALMVTNANYSLTQTGVNKMLFHFVYNTRGQLIEKTVPGKGVTSIVYDPLNRVVLIQDANLTGGNNWNYIKYDALNRPVSQGIYHDTDPSRLSRFDMQNYVSTNTTLGTAYGLSWYEEKSPSGSASGYYTNAVFPTTGITPLYYTYYDDYDIDDNGTADYNYASQSSLTTQGSQTTAPIKSVPTMVSTRTVGNGLGDIWLLKVLFYDKNGHLIQTQSNNQLNYTAGTITDYATIVPDFMGVPQTTLVTKNTGSITTPDVRTDLTYDHAYRVTAVSQKYGSGTAKIVTAYTYNEIGQLIKKGLGNTSGSSYLQNVDMRYNIRGQLLKINNSKLSNDGGVTNSDSNDLFGMEFFFDGTDSHLTSSANFSGKISAVKWMSKDGSGTSSYERAFSYAYDGVGRYTGETYSERTTSSTSAFTVTHGWDETVSGYYANGNIMGLTRNTSTPGATGTQIDNLTYSYDTNNPNQLKNVAETSDVNTGFKNPTSSTADYGYDSNSGNLTSDPYKGITSITYNVLNRAHELSISGTQYIDYTYNSSGNLMRKQTYKSGAATVLTDYIDGYVYDNSGGTETLAYFSMPEGMVRNNGGTLKQEFVITDQQGNARVSFSDNGSGTAVVQQENSYYGFGMIMLGGMSMPTVPNKNLYNGGSEWQKDYGDVPDYYQTFYRNYDAAIGRFVAIDPKAESAESMTPYHYAGNNPIMGNDPMGDLDQLRVGGGDGVVESFAGPTNGHVGNSLFDINAAGGNGGGTGFGGGARGDGSAAGINARYDAEMYVAAMKGDFFALAYISSRPAYATTTFTPSDALLSSYGMEIAYHNGVDTYFLQDPKDPSKNSYYTSLPNGTPYNGIYMLKKGKNGSYDNRTLVSGREYNVDDANQGVDPISYYGFTGNVSGYIGTGYSVAAVSGYNATVGTNFKTFLRYYPKNFYGNQYTKVANVGNGVGYGMLAVSVYSDYQLYNTIDPQTGKTAISGTEFWFDSIINTGATRWGGLYGFLLGGYYNYVAKPYIKDFVPAHPEMVVDTDWLH